MGHSEGFRGLTPRPESARELFELPENFVVTPAGFDQPVYLFDLPIEGIAGTTYSRVELAGDFAGENRHPPADST